MIINHNDKPCAPRVGPPKTHMTDAYAQAHGVPPLLFEPSLPLGAEYLLCTECGLAMRANEIAWETGYHVYATKKTGLVDGSQAEVEVENSPHLPTCKCGNISKFTSAVIMDYDKKGYLCFQLKEDIGGKGHKPIGFEEVEPYRTKRGYTSTFRKFEGVDVDFRGMMTTKEWLKLAEKHGDIRRASVLKAIGRRFGNAKLSKEVLHAVKKPGFLVVYPHSAFKGPTGGFKTEIARAKIVAAIEAMIRADKIAKIKAEGRAARYTRDRLEIEGLKAKLKDEVDRTWPINWISHSDFEKWFASIAGMKYSMDRGRVITRNGITTYYDPVWAGWIEEPEHKVRTVSYVEDMGDNDDEDSWEPEEEVLAIEDEDYPEELSDDVPEEEHNDLNMERHLGKFIDPEENTESIDKYWARRRIARRRRALRKHVITNMAYLRKHALWVKFFSDRDSRMRIAERLEVLYSMYLRLK